MPSGITVGGEIIHTWRPAPEGEGLPDYDFRKGRGIMTRTRFSTDVNKCVGCLACVPLQGNLTRAGGLLLEQGAAHRPGTCARKAASGLEVYYLPMQCQHCEDPECVKVCPTGASHKLADGTVQVDKEKCIGCQFCAMSCPHGVRYLNQTERVVEKCTLCEQKIAQGRAAPVRGPVRRPGAVLRRFGAGARELRGPRGAGEKAATSPTITARRLG